MKGATLFLKLKYRLKELELYPYSYVAEQLGMSPYKLSSRMSGATSWQLQEMHDVLRLIQEPDEKMAEYFPEHGTARLKKC